MIYVHIVSVGHLLCRPGVYMLLWRCSGVLQPPFFCTAVFQACPHNNSAGALQCCSGVCGPGGGERTRPGLQCQEVRTGTLMSLAPVGPIQTFPFLSDRNPLWTCSSQPQVFTFPPNYRPAMFSIPCCCLHLSQVSVCCPLCVT